MKPAKARLPFSSSVGESLSDECELWSLERPTVPPRSKLVPLAPQGIGTPAVESLASYLARLADAHCVSIGHLVEQVIAPIVQDKQGHHTQRFISFSLMASGNSHYLNSVGNARQAHLLDALAELTLRNDLASLTLSRWSGIIGDQRLLRQSKAWCPACYEQQLTDGGTVYDLLLWSTNSVSACPEHKTPLVTCCPYCGKTNPFLRSYTLPGYCSFCEVWLGNDSSSERSAKSLGEEGCAPIAADLEWPLWVAQAVGRLLVYSWDPGNKPPLNGFAHMLNRVIITSFGGVVSTFARAMGIGQTTLHYWAVTSAGIRLDSLLYVCHCVGAEPLDVVATGSTPANVDPMEVRQRAIKGRKPDRYRQPPDLTVLRRQLVSLLRDEDAASMSVLAVAERLDCTRDALRKYFPEVCKRISARHKEWSVAKHKEVVAKQIREVCGIATRLHSEGVYPSVVKVGRELESTIIFLNPDVTQAYRQVLCDLGIRSSRAITNVIKEEVRSEDMDYSFQGRDKQPALVPTRSRLHRLEPRGLGSPLVESLTSYVARLAASHAVTPDALVAHEILPLFGREYLPAATKISGTTWKRLVAINGTGVWAAEWVSILGSLTLEPSLRSLTLLPWADVLPPRRLLRRERAWCPLCFEEWRGADVTVYEPLIWCIEAVETCQVHSVRLQTACPNKACGRSAPPLGPRSTVGYCAKCGQWLGSTKLLAETTLPSPRESAWHAYVRDAVGDILAFASVEGKAIKPERVQVANALDGYATRILGGDIRELARQVGISARSARDIVGGHQLPTLGTLLQIAYRLSTTPVALLGLWKGLPQAAARLLPIGGRRIRKSRHKDFPEEQLRASLQACVDDEGSTPQSMAEVARGLGYDPSHLLRRFPVLCKAISRRYKAYVQARKALAYSELWDEVQAAVMTVHARGEYPSHMRVRAELKVNRRMREPIANAAWQDALSRIDYKRVRGIRKRPLQNGQAAPVL